MKTLNCIFTLPITWLLIQSCGDKKQISDESKGPCISSYEIVPGCKDTVNFTDCNKKKQGHWIIRKWAVVNKKNGAELVWSEEGFYVDDKREGYWKKYAVTGEITDSINYKNDVVVQM